MRKAIAVLGLFSSLLPGLVQADELDDFTDKLLQIAPSKCYEEASTISGNHIRNVLPDMALEGVRQAKKFDTAWGPGNENYRQVHDVVEMAYQDEELSNGPLVNISLRSLVRTAASKWSAAERADYLAFLKQKGGRLYWDSMVDGALCAGVIEAVTVKLPRLLPPGEEKKRVEALKDGANFRIMSMDIQASLLPKDQRAKMNKLGPALLQSLQDAFGAANLAYGPRAAKALQAAAPQLLNILAAYKQ